MCENVHPQQGTREKIGPNPTYFCLVEHTAQYLFFWTLTAVQFEFKQHLNLADCFRVWGLRSFSQYREISS